MSSTLIRVLTCLGQPSTQPAAADQLTTAGCVWARVVGTRQPPPATRDEGEKGREGERKGGNRELHLQGKHVTYQAYPTGCPPRGL